jgi:DNA-directed RNA polymerase subunit RPC12/RpoP
MPNENLSEYQCSNCRAKLLLKRQSEPRRRREEALCPYCSVNLPPRRGSYTLQYTLIAPPIPLRPPSDFNQVAKLATDVASRQRPRKDPSSRKERKKRRRAVVTKG